MKLYREGTLLRDCLGDLWMIMALGKQSYGLDCYVLKRLADSFVSRPVYLIVHREMDLVSEA